jgi:predicted Na+-dependent transporter
MYAQNKITSILLVAFVIAMAISKQREVILTHGAALMGSLAIALLCFAGFIVSGWLFAWRRPPAERITYAACSSFNNAALGVSLALLHFPPPVTLFVAVSEVAWSLLPCMFSHFLQRIRA